MPDEQWVGLADAIRALRSELTAVMAEGADKDVRFELGPVEMEFLLEVQREAGADAGVKFWVVSFGSKGSVKSGSTHRVTLTLQPLDARLARQLDRIRVHGIGDRPTCLEALEPDGDAALTLFDAAPADDTSPSREELDRRCHAAVTRAT